MQAEADRRAGIRTPVPRAEPDQVVRSAVRDDQGRILGRYAGAITAGMTNKTDVLGMRSMMPNAPTNEGSTYQMDLMDMSTRGGATGFGLLAVDVNSRYLYGELVRDKTLPGLIAAFSRLLQQYGAMDPNKTGDMLGAPATIDTDRERAWTTPQWQAEMARRGIQHRFKTDRFSPNSLGMIDEKIKRVKTYIRQRLTEEGEDADSWEQYFGEAVEAQNMRVHKVLYNQAPEELYDSGGEPEDEDAEHTIFALQKDSAMKFHKNKRKHARRVEQLQTQGGFRAPERLNWQNRRILQATHEGRARQP